MNAQEVCNIIVHTLSETPDAGVETITNLIMIRVRREHANRIRRQGESFINAADREEGFADSLEKLMAKEFEV